MAGSENLPDDYFDRLEEAGLRDDAYLIDPGVYGDWAREHEDYADLGLSAELTGALWAADIPADPGEWGEVEIWARGDEWGISIDGVSFETLMDIVWDLWDWYDGDIDKDIDTGGTDS